MAFFIDVQHLCTFNTVASLIITFCQKFGRHRTPSVHPSLLMFRIDCPMAWISSSLVLYRVLAVVLSLWQRDYNRIDSGENNDTWLYRIPSFIMTMQGVASLLLSRTSCAASNGRFWNIHRTHPIWIHANKISSSKGKNHCERRSTTQEMNLSVL